MHSAVPEFPDDPQVRDLTLALNYRCNSACRFCFIEPELAGQHADTPWEVIDEVFRKNRESGAFERVIFSGAEATLRKDFPEIVGAARERGGFRFIRVQTNARRMAERSYCQRLVAAGLSEFFVSIHAPTPEMDARMTRSDHSFEQMRAGVANILELGGKVISNTAVTSDNVLLLPDLARLLVEMGVNESQIWAFIEFGDIGQADQHVNFEQVLPPLGQALKIFDDSDHPVSLSWFPQCLLGADAPKMDNHRAFTLILDGFARRMHANAEFGCPHAQSCSAFGNSCIGLHSRYRDIFGDPPGLRAYGSGEAP